MLFIFLFKNLILSFHILIEDKTTEMDSKVVCGYAYLIHLKTNHGEAFVFSDSKPILLK